MRRETERRKECRLLIYSFGGKCTTNTVSVGKRMRRIRKKNKKKRERKKEKKETKKEREKGKQ